MFIKEACRRHSENCDWGYYIKDENDFSVKVRTHIYMNNYKQSILKYQYDHEL